MQAPLEKSDSFYVETGRYLLSPIPVSDRTPVGDGRRLGKHLGDQIFILPPTTQGTRYKANYHVFPALDARDPSFSGKHRQLVMGDVSGPPEFDRCIGGEKPAMFRC